MKKTINAFLFGSVILYLSACSPTLTLKKENGKIKARIENNDSEGNKLCKLVYAYNLKSYSIEKHTAMGRKFEDAECTRSEHRECYEMKSVRVGIDFELENQRSNETVYAVAICNEKAAESSLAPTETSVETAAKKRIFLTADVVSPIFGSGSAGMSAADAVCNDSTAPAKPTDGGTFKALIVGSTRKACTTADCGGGASENLDWVLAPNTAYYQHDGSDKDLIGTTNAKGIFDFPLTAAFGSYSATVITGLNTDWTNSTDNCTDWNSGIANYSIGSSSATGSTSISNSTVSCGDSNRLMCVEQ
jgi:hypothetical protein